MAPFNCIETNTAFPLLISKATLNSPNLFFFNEMSQNRFMRVLTDYSNVTAQMLDGNDQVENRHGNQNDV